MPHLTLFSPHNERATTRAHSIRKNVSTWKVARTACHRSNRSNFAAKMASSSGVLLRLSIVGAAWEVARKWHTDVPEARSKGRKRPRGWVVTRDTTVARKINSVALMAQ